MQGFEDALTLTEMGLNWRLWKVETAFVYERPCGAQIIVPANFETDGASVPQFLWVWLPTWGTYSRAAVVHDWLCFLLHYGDPHPQAKTRAQADAIFWEAMGVCGTNWLTKIILYAGVRIGAYLPGTNCVDYNNASFVPASPTAPIPDLVLVPTVVGPVVVTTIPISPITPSEPTKL